jgi:hypothetical protein
MLAVRRSPGDCVGQSSVAAGGPDTCESYRIVRFLGAGGFGTTYKAES